MKYLAHIDGDREQSVKEHLQGTAELAEKFAAKFRKADWGCNLTEYMTKRTF